MIKTLNDITVKSELHLVRSNGTICKIWAKHSETYSECEKLITKDYYLRLKKEFNR